MTWIVTSNGVEVRRCASEAEAKILKRQILREDMQAQVIITKET